MIEFTTISSLIRGHENYLEFLGAVGSLSRVAGVFAAHVRAAHLAGAWNFSVVHSNAIASLLRHSTYRSQGLQLKEASLKYAPSSGVMDISSASHVLSTLTCDLCRQLELSKILDRVWSDGCPPVSWMWYCLYICV